MGRISKLSLSRNIQNAGISKLLLLKRKQILQSEDLQETLHTKPKLLLLAELIE